MNKKVMVGVAIVALSIGGASTIALQSHAEQATIKPATTAIAPTQTDITSPSDTDNIQDGNQNGVDMPDIAVTNQKDGETADDATTTIKQVDTKEQGEGSAVDTTEVEDGN